jgi:hypothetical protein
MDISSLVKYVFIVKQREQKQSLNYLLLFFTPCEELSGGSMFSVLSENYRLIQPCVDKVNADLINQINSNIKNINHYLVRN